MTKNTKDSLHIVQRNLTLEDYDSLKELMINAYSDLEDAFWLKKEIRKLLELFPEGQFCIEVNGKIVAGALSIIVNYAKFGDEHTYDQITAHDTFATHNPKGDVLYGIDVCVHSEYRNMRLARRLYEMRKELCERLNLRSIIAGGRIPNYELHAKEMTPKQYIDKVKLKQVYDPILTFQLNNDFHVKRILRGYLKGDTGSKEYATLLEWNNVYYESTMSEHRKSVVRLGLVQWQMRPFDTLEDLYTQVDYFVDAVSDYQSDFMLIPEFFNAPLMGQFDHLGEAKAVRKLAEYTEQVREKISEFAVTYNVNIIAGSMPYMEGDKLLNAGFLCRRDGSTEMYQKIHITPGEESAWGMQGGETFRVFDTDCGKIGVLICYDVEFPELCRIMADEGIRILFVPFWTDTQNGYMRVRHCAQARAIENECYVAIAGCVGNLPKVNNMDIQYAQSGVFTPSDFSFPNNCVKAEATPNTEMTLIADVDLDLLRELHEFGSVRNLKQRRKDIYRLSRRK